MDEASIKVAKGLRASSDKPLASWSDLLARIARNRSDDRPIQGPPAREWRDLVADMIAGRR